MDNETPEGIDAEDWNEMTPTERRRWLEYQAEDHWAEYLAECSPSQRARAMWEQS